MAVKNESFTYPEIMRQPHIWQETLAMMQDRGEEMSAFFSAAAPDEVIFTGCGSSYFLSVAAASLFAAETGRAARAVPASEVFLQPAGVFRPGARVLTVGISRSGETTETVRALRFVREQGWGRTIALTAEPDSPLAREGDRVLALPHVRERSVVMTGSFTSMLLALQVWAARVSGREERLGELGRLPEAARSMLPAVDEAARRMGEDLTRDQVIFLGMGAYFGLACEGMLKLKEMTQVPSEAFNPLEFRHGPISVLTENSRVLLLSSLAVRPYEGDLVNDLRRLGAQVIGIGERVHELDADVRVELPVGFSDWGRSVLYLPYMQLMACYRAQRAGLNPDQPRHLNRVVTLEA